MSNKKYDRKTFAKDLQSIVNSCGLDSYLETHDFMIAKVLCDIIERQKVFQDNRNIWFYGTL